MVTVKPEQSVPVVGLEGESSGPASPSPAPGRRWWLLLLLIPLLGLAGLIRDDRSSPPTDSALDEPLPATTVPIPRRGGSLAVTLLPGSGSLVGIAPFEGGVVAAASAWDGSEIWMSRDGSDWRHVTGFPGWEVSHLVASDEAVLAFGGEGSWDGARRTVGRVSVNGESWHPVDMGPLADHRLVDVASAGGRLLAVVGSWEHQVGVGRLWLHDPDRGWLELEGGEFTSVAATVDGKLMAAGRTGAGPQVWRLQVYDLLPLPQSEHGTLGRARTFQDLVGLPAGGVAALLGPRGGGTLGQAMWLDRGEGLEPVEAMGVDRVDFEGLIPVPGGVVAPDAHRAATSSRPPLAWHSTDGTSWVSVPGSPEVSSVDSAAIAGDTLLLGGLTHRGTPWLGRWAHDPPRLLIPAPQPGEGHWARLLADGGFPGALGTHDGGVHPALGEMVVSRSGRHETWLTRLADLTSVPLRFTESPAPTDGALKLAATTDSLFLVAGGDLPGIWQVEPDTGATTPEVVWPAELAHPVDVTVSGNLVEAVFEARGRILLVEGDASGWSVEEIQSPPLPEATHHTSLAAFRDELIYVVWSDTGHQAHHWDGRAWNPLPPESAPAHTVRTNRGLLGYLPGLATEYVHIPSPDPATWRPLHLPDGWVVPLDDRVLVVQPRMLWESGDLGRWSAIPLDISHGFTGVHPQPVAGLATVALVAQGAQGAELWRWVPP